MTWQNQQTVCATTEDSDQPGHLTSLTRVYSVHSVGNLGWHFNIYEQGKFRCLLR